MLDQIIGTAATLAPAGLSFWGQERANEANQASADKMMRHQRWMSEHQHQMQVKDLRAAGLNPLLSANSGASVGAGAQATSQNSMGEGISTALQIQQLKNTIEKTKSEIGLNKATEIKQRQDAATSKALERLYDVNQTTGKGDPRNILGTLREAVEGKAKEVYNRPNQFWNQKQQPIQLQPRR